MDLVEAASFLDQNRSKMYYVGFLKSESDTWFPLCVVSDPGEDPKLDTLLVSPSYPEMERVVQDYAKQIPKVVQTFIQFLMSEEIENLMERYALVRMALVLPEETGDGCGCGCGCH